MELKRTGRHVTIETAATVAPEGSQQGFDDLAMAAWLTQEVGVAAIPMSVFYRSPPATHRYVRFCFCKKPETLEEARRRLRRLAD